MTGLPGNGRTQLPREFEGLAFLLALDLALGVWLQLHSDWAPSLFLAHLPLVGFAGLFLMFFPDASKDRFGAWLASIAASARFRLVVAWLLAITLVLGSARSSVVIDAVDPDASATMQLVTAAQEGDLRATPASPLRINRLTTPVHHQLWIWPFGRKVWLYTPIMVSRVVRALPWRPASVEYPDDFDSMVTVRVLPTSRLLNRVGTHDVRIVFRDRDSVGPVVATAALDTVGFAIAFTSPAPVSEAHTARWRVWLVGQHAMSGEPLDENVQSGMALLLRLWSHSRWIRAAHPLRFGDAIYWEVRSRGDSLGAHGSVVFSRHEEDLPVGRD